MARVSFFFFFFDIGATKKKKKKNRAQQKNNFNTGMESRFDNEQVNQGTQQAQDTKQVRRYILRRGADCNA